MFSYKQALQSPQGPTHSLGIWELVIVETYLQPQALEPGPELGSWSRPGSCLWVVLPGTPQGGGGLSTLSTLLCEGPTEETEAGNPAFSFSEGNWLAQCHAAAGVCHGRWLPLCRRREAGSHPDPQRWPLPPGGQHVQKKQRVCECPSPGVLVGRGHSTRDCRRNTGPKGEVQGVCSSVQGDCRPRSL